MTAHEIDQGEQVPCSCGQVKRTRARWRCSTPRYLQPGDHVSSESCISCPPPATFGLGVPDRRTA